MPTDKFILTVQKCVIGLQEAEKNKEDHLRKWRDARRDLYPLRHILSKRLKKMNRLDPKFFPVGAFVEYGNETIAIKKKGIVTGYKYLPFPKVLVHFEGDIPITEVEPEFLKLLFIR